VRHLPVFMDYTVRDALYTDAYQKRDGRWVCVGAAVVALGR
jgi:hypothetical protein